ncbi:uncharacterized protein LOC129786255 [Lutzomyia longipalpis]|uniref:uncharacterized protein LOC129786255 n=1 Tax=Lutzomyia longipalpis TaxID=7200 RepID=UPI002483BC3C|nr:uncharacterized protein LOC129786255 [Lutzomyia longipalpis]XP_055677119.1 uncharacterized protein LOC129786255 [Lutzomyia longipalpis]XP_055677120.1 uncharacterized protein LOC129786255 [Lutzomyia longipalpis]
MVSGTQAGCLLLLAAALVCAEENHSTRGIPLVTSPLKLSTTEAYPRYEKVPTTKLIKITEDSSALNSTGRPESAGRSILPSVGNELWDGLLRDCLRKPTFSCFQKNVFTYLDGALALADVNVTQNFVFLRNGVDYEHISKEANDQEGSENEISDTDDEEEPRLAESPIEEVTNALYGKGVKFVMTHDVQVKLPGIFFDGATLKISPRSFEGNGALVKLELLPRTELEPRETGRIFFKHIKKHLKNKLLLGLLAVILIIKLIKIKIFWLLPLFVGVTTAKKLVLKFLLFLFPALSHIFKLCSWYHHTYHQTKFHHHQHHINHLHTVIPPWAYEHEQHHGPPHGHEHHGPVYHHGAGPELIYTKPPAGHPSDYLYGGVSSHSFQSDWDITGPAVGGGAEYFSDRNSHVGTFKPKLDDANEISSWGLGSTVSPPIQHSSQRTNPLLQEPIRNFTPRMPVYPAPVYIPKRGQTASIIAAQYSPNTAADAQLIREAQRQEALRIQAEQKLIADQQKILHQQPFVQDPQHQQNILRNATGLGDPFYGPIVQRIDRIFQQMGVVEEGCKERLVCSMYKNPARFSPHSNFISAELSRDTHELQKPTSTNPAVIRFYKYVQAAREGQDQGDCIRTYPQCPINTER